MMTMMGWAPILSTIFWILIIGLVIYGVISLVMKPFEKKEDPALQILRERFARGEISDEELEQKSAALRKK